PLFNFLCG
nr:Chain C, CED-3 fragment [synthetic construct]4M9X_D Chain D, CED-3 fragment [synthetic construct]